MQKKKKKVTFITGFIYSKCHVSVEESSILPKQRRNYHLPFLGGLRDCHGLAISGGNRGERRGCPLLPAAQRAPSRPPSMYVRGSPVRPASLETGHIHSEFPNPQAPRPRGCRRTAASRGRCEMRQPQRSSQGWACLEHVCPALLGAGRGTERSRTHATLPQPSLVLGRGPCSQPHGK